MAVVSSGVNTTFTKTLPSGTVTSYGDVSLYVVNTTGVTTRFNTVVVNASAIAVGSLTTSNVIFPVAGSYTCTLSYESNVDLDTTGTVITPIVSTVVTVVDPLATTVVL